MLDGFLPIKVDFRFRKLSWTWSFRWCPSGTGFLLSFIMPCLQLSNQYHYYYKKKKKKTKKKKKKKKKKNVRLPLTVQPCKILTIMLTFTKYAWIISTTTSEF